MITPTLLNYRYKVIQVLASGGFGETFLAEDTQMPSRRKCVIKQLKPLEDKPQIYQLVQERFQREAALLEQLSNGKNQIPQLYAYFTHDGQFYLVQEYIEGETLTTKLKQQGILSEILVKEILINILPVLEYIHSKHIVHRDIKPDNILIRYVDSKPVLIDFGAVKETMHTVMAVDENSTQSIVIGTPGFMPSEQTAGRPVYSSDLYSLGLTAIYLLTGKMPQDFSNNPATGEILWREYAPNISSSFAVVLDRAIQFHPRDRFSSAKEMLQALQEELIPIPPTIIEFPTTSATRDTQPPTEVSAPKMQTQPPTMLIDRGMKDWQKASIIGGVIGVCVIAGMALINRQSPANIQVERTVIENKADNSGNIRASVQSMDNSALQSQNKFLPATSSITRDAAISILNRWQKAKGELFAPPFNRRLGAELTTGEAYRKNIGPDSSLEWLAKNNAYYRYGVQKIESVEKFVASDDRATIEIIITEDRKFYQNGQIKKGDNTTFDTRLVRYSLLRKNGNLKISDYETIKVLSKR